MVLGTEGLSEEFLAPSRRKKDHRVPQVDDRHSTAVIESPAMPYCRRD
jgi:hypothetical protein